MDGLDAQIANFEQFLDLKMGRAYFALIVELFHKNEENMYRYYVTNLM